MFKVATQNIPIGKSLLKSLNTYFLLTEFEVRTVSYGPSFPPLIYGPSAKRAGHESRGKMWIRNLSMDEEDEVSKIFIISLLCAWRVQEQFLLTRNGFKFLTHLKSKRSQFEIVFKSLAHVNTHFREKESFKLLLAIKVKNS